MWICWYDASVMNIAWFKHVSNITFNWETEIALLVTSRTICWYGIIYVECQRSSIDHCWLFERMVFNAPYTPWVRLKVWVIWLVSRLCRQPNSFGISNIWLSARLHNIHLRWIPGYIQTFRPITGSHLFQNIRAVGKHLPWRISPLIRIRGRPNLVCFVSLSWDY